MPFTTPDKIIKTIRQNDPDFYIDNGITISPRAGLEINQRCPENYRSLILECVEHGWLKPIAYIKESEYIWEKLGE